ncbi:MAG: PIG-L family deacetylase [Chloroflexi bacterium]|nr:PIG-L family deacetylase [Chloroflexota bacterium]
MASMLERPERALVVFAHPDDAEIGAGGTIARWTREGTQVYYLVCTNGDKGSADPEMTPERLAAIREREQRAAAEVLGIKEVVFLRYPDGELEDTRQLRGEVVRAIRRFRPDVVLCPEPFRRSSYQHRDHRVAGRASLDACFPYARDRLHFPEHEREGLAPHKVGSILFWQAEEPDVFTDIKETLDLKVKALLCHASQMSNPGRDVPQRVRENAQQQATRSPEPMEYAEGFRKVEFRR